LFSSVTELSKESAKSGSANYANNVTDAKM